MPLLRCCALATGCFIRIGGTPRHTPIITGPGMWWSMTGYIIMLTRTFSGFSRKDSSLLPCWLSLPCLPWCTSMPSLSAWAFSTQCSSCSSCSLEWLSTSLSMIVGKDQFGMFWCGRPFSWARESFCAFILKSGMHVSTVLWKIPHFWIMFGHVPGLVVTCFRSLDSVSVLVSEDWVLCLTWGQLLLKSHPGYLEHSKVYRRLIPFLGHLKLTCWKFIGGLYNKARLSFSFLGEGRLTAGVMTDFCCIMHIILSFSNDIAVFVSWLRPIRLNLLFSWPVN